MQYFQKILLKDGRECVLRNAVAQEVKGVMESFRITHSETDFLLSQPDEIHMTEEEEAAFLQKKSESENEIEIIAEVGGKIAGAAGIERVGKHRKLAHRCDFGISVEKAYWGLGIGRALTLACLACARKAGYEQIELEVVSENERAVKLYESVGFVEYGRNPRDFKSDISGYQEVIYMRLEL